MLAEDKPEGVGATLALGALNVLAFVYDVLTSPLYWIAQKPWKTNQYTDKIQATVISKDATSVTYRSVHTAQSIHQTMIRENIDTMTKVLDWATSNYPNKRCFGTREILGEEDEIQPNGRIFKKYSLGLYRWKTFQEVNIFASNFGKGLRELGNEPRKNVVIFAETREEWMIAAQALFKQNIPLVTVYATLGDEAIAHAINETEVTTVITSYDLMPKFKHILHKTPNVSTLIYMPDQLKQLDKTGYKDGVKIVLFDEVLELGVKSTIVNDPPTSDDVAIIMYTSGSTGVPKGVILSHKNLISTLKAFCDSTRVYEDDVLIGFLPLAHVFELLVECVCLVSAVPIGYSGPLTMADTGGKIKKGNKGDATLLHPTCMSSVPLILDRMAKTIREKVNKSGFFKRILFKFAYDYKRAWKRKGYSTPLIDGVIFAPIRATLGGRLRLILAGGAPLSAETHEFVSNCFCVRITQGYGLTETASLATISNWYDRSFGRAGAPSTVTDIKVVNWDEGNYRVTDKPYPRGEILVGGDCVSVGYYKLPQNTSSDYFEADGRRWFRTGDICEVHDDGVVNIIDRKKDLVKLQSGEYISLGKVEAVMKTSPLIENICVYADPTQTHCVALVVPNRDRLIQLGAQNGIQKNFEELCQSSEMEKLALDELLSHGTKNKLGKLEIPMAVKLISDIWLPENGLVTAAFKLKRKNIQERYKSQINSMYVS